MPRKEGCRGHTGRNPVNALSVSRNCDTVQPSCRRRPPASGARTTTASVLSLRRKACAQVMCAQQGGQGEGQWDGAGQGRIVR
jgi:hypothetical protein